MTLSPAERSRLSEIARLNLVSQEPDPKLQELVAAAALVTKDNPLVTQDGIHCYAGVPLITARGYAIGTLCVLGNDQRVFLGEDVARLRKLATQVMSYIESRAASTQP